MPPSLKRMLRIRTPEFVTLFDDRSTTITENFIA